MSAHDEEPPDYQRYHYCNTCDKPWKCMRQRIGEICDGAVISDCPSCAWTKRQRSK